MTMIMMVLTRWS